MFCLEDSECITVSHKTLTGHKCSSTKLCSDCFVRIYTQKKNTFNTRSLCLLCKDETNSFPPLLTLVSQETETALSTLRDHGLIASHALLTQALHKLKLKGEAVANDIQELISGNNKILRALKQYNTIKQQTRPVHSRSLRTNTSKARKQRAEKLQRQKYHQLNVVYNAFQENGLRDYM